ncbi:preflagellin peptidase [Halolamina pelagica]|uniref:Preflagellin peptidase n=1 Tax=Halolamina pelagica TaxID=699431 RepID=A0A0P7GMH8_9EURY|nr:A24 family peptidase [Halolamina pelagica]KPN29770.1 preflagellin peptidase [Halolamina pelagica]
MVDSLGAVASLGDLARLLAVPLLGWAALRDIRTRRVPNWVWYVLGILGIVLLVTDLLYWYPFNTYSTNLMLIRVAISIGFVAPLCFLFYLMEGFGGADLKALLALSILFPTYPAYYPPITLVEMGVPAILPYVNTRIGVFSLTILTNTVIVGIASPLALAVRNALSGRFGSRCFLE